MTPQEAAKWYGATHYSIMQDGETPQMYYRTKEAKFSDGTKAKWIEYLSYANIWMGSVLKNINKLTKIEK